MRGRPSRSAFAGVAAGVAVFMGLAGLGGASFDARSSPPTTAPTDLSQLAWLAGTWVHSSQGDAVQEVWLPPRGGVMLGLHLDTRRARAFYEYLRIEETTGPDGPGLVLYASPLGREATPFHAASGADGHVVFENPEHDFPQRIEYLRDGDRLQMSASGGDRMERWEMKVGPSPWG